MSQIQSKLQTEKYGNHTLKSCYLLTALVAILVFEANQTFAADASCPRHNRGVVVAYYYDSSGKVIEVEAVTRKIRNRTSLTQIVDPSTFSMPTDADIPNQLPVTDQDVQVPNEAVRAVYFGPKSTSEPTCHTFVPKWIEEQSPSMHGRTIKRACADPVHPCPPPQTCHSCARGCCCW